MSFKGKLGEVQLVGSPIAVEKPRLASGEPARIAVKVKAAQAPTRESDRQIRAHPVAEQEAEPALDLDARFKGTMAGQATDQFSLVILSVRQYQDLLPSRRRATSIDD